MQRSLWTRYSEVLWVWKCRMTCVCNSKCNVDFRFTRHFHVSTDAINLFSLMSLSLYTVVPCVLALYSFTIIEFYDFSMKAISLLNLRRDDTFFLERYLRKARIISLQMLQINTTWHCKTSDFWCLTTWQKHVFSFKLVTKNKLIPESLPISCPGLIFSPLIILPPQSPATYVVL